MPINYQKLYVYISSLNSRRTAGDTKLFLIHIRSKYEAKISQTFSTAIVTFCAQEVIQTSKGTKHNRYIYQVIVRDRLQLRVTFTAQLTLKIVYEAHRESSSR